MSTEASARIFFSSPTFAVVGASSNTAKFGHKIFAWYAHHDLPVTPINPASSTVTVPGLANKDFPTKPSLSALTDPKDTAVSIITPPPVTLKVLEEAKSLGIPAVWLQPGTFDDEVLAFAREDEGSGKEGSFKSVVAGDGGRGSEGWCVLVDGERALRAVGKL